MDITDYQNALLTNPFDSEIRMDFAELLFSQEKLSECDQQINILLDSLENDARPLILKAKIKHQQGDSDSALKNYIKAKNLDNFKIDDSLENLTKLTNSLPGKFSVVQNNITPLIPKDQESISFDDVVGMEKLKKTLRLSIIEPFLRPSLFAKFKRKAGGGVLLYGPPGCGKTMIAKAIATECNATFIQVEISDILSMWIGESENNIASIFDKARANKPCVLFFDELDALAYSRSKSSSDKSRTTVNEFLNQLDGFGKDNENILILAATNMPWDVDSAMKRPGRFSKQVFVPPPDSDAIAFMLEKKLSGLPVEKDIPFTALAQKAKYFSGADIDGLIDTAQDSTIAEIISTGKERNINAEDLASALEEMSASTLDWLSTAKNLVKYAGIDGSYKDVERYLKKIKLI